MNGVDLARRQPLAGGASVGLLAAIVLGLMAMHSLSMPESGSHHEVGTSLSVAYPTTPDSALGEERLLPGHGSTPGGHMFALCGVMLAAAAAVAWLLRRRERRHPAPTLALRDVPGAIPPRRPRAGPPRYLTLSVCRS